MFYVTVIKGKLNMIHGYAVASLSDRKEVPDSRFMVAADRTPEMAYEAATDLATLLNVAAE